MISELQSIKSLRSWRHDRQLTCCRFVPDGSGLLAAGHDGGLHRFHFEGDECESVAAHRGWVEAMKWTPDKAQLITADSWGQVCAWRWAGGSLAPSPTWTVAAACASWLRDLAVSHEGRWLATCGNEPVVRVFSAADGRLVHELRGHEQPVMSLAFAPDGKTLASGDLYGVVRDWNLDDGTCRRQLNAGRLFQKFHHYRQGGVRAMTFDLAGKTLYCGGFEGINANQAQGNPMVLAFDWETGKQAAQLAPSEAFIGPITDLAWHPDGFLIAAGSSEAGGALWFWRTGEEKSCHHVKHATSLRRFDLAGDGRQLAVAAFADLNGQRGGNGRRLNKSGEYPDFGGALELYQWT